MKTQGEDPFFEDGEWERCIRHFLASVRGYSGSEKTERQYRSVLRRLFADPQKKPDTFTTAQIEDFVCSKNCRTGRAIKSSTRNARLGAIRSFYAYAAKFSVKVKSGKKLKRLLSGIDPTDGIKCVAVDNEPRTIKEEVLRSLFSVIPRDTVKGLRDRALFLSYFWTARRCSEILRLRWSDVEQRNGRVYYHWRGKGHARQDDCAELPRQAWVAIIAYLETAGRLEKMKPDDFIFISMGHQSLNKGKPLTSECVWYILRSYAAKIVESDIRVHDFRHVAAQKRFKENGGKIEPIMNLLRHKNSKTTWGYLRLEMEPEDEDAKLLASIYGDL
jgi:site-specific recombinase XerD